jgi:hypothetical protein
VAELPADEPTDPEAVWNVLPIGAVVEELSAGHAGLDARSTVRLLLLPVVAYGRARRLT